MQKYWPSLQVLVMKQTSPAYFQFSSVQFSSDQFSSAIDNTFTLTYHYSFQFSSVQFNSVQISSVQFRSVQFSCFMPKRTGPEFLHFGYFLVQYFFLKSFLHVGAMDSKKMILVNNRRKMGKMELCKSTTNEEKVVNNRKMDVEKNE